ncbi:PaaI family thioesterase [Altererythrobacter sp. C41]|uniref:PaaI family thioesterase n=1 Tax=Altererythrobacter sp. C41 TaxID=2806021 RepID=UPI003083690B
MEAQEPAFDYREDPDHPGWHTWNLRDQTRFNAVVMGDMLVRTEGDKCRLRMFPERKHTNLQDIVHGAVTLSLIDISLFAAMRTLTGGDAGPAVTLELSTQFIGAGKPGEPLDAVVEVLRETGRLLFLRGEVVQGDHLVAGFTGLVRKASRK